MLVSAFPLEAAPYPRVASTPYPVPQGIQAPTSSGVVQPPPANHASQASPNPAAIIPKTIPLSMPAVAAAQPAGTDAEAHKETEDAGPATMLDSVRDVAAVPTAAMTRQTASPVDGDRLPPLPTDIARPAFPSLTPETAPTPSAESNSAAASPGASEELPPLPAEVAHSASPKPAADTSPTPPAALNPSGTSPGAAEELPPLPADIAHTASSKPTADDRATPLVAPTPLLVLPNLAPNGSQTPTGATNSLAGSSGGANNSAPSHTEEDALPPLRNDHESLTLPSSGPGLSHNNDGGPSAAPLQTVPGEPADSRPDPANASSPASAPTDIKLPAFAAQNSAVAAAPATQPYLATNSNSAEIPAAASGSGSVTRVDLDASSIPPAIEDQEPIGSNSRSFTRDRPNSRSILRPDLRREVEMIARNQEAASRSQRSNDRQPGGTPVDTSASDPRTQFQLDTSRAAQPGRSAAHTRNSCSRRLGSSGSTQLVSPA